MDFEYKKYSLDNVEKWVRDALVSAEAAPEEIYDTIHKVVNEEYYYFKHHTGRCYELLALLNGNGQSYKDVLKEREYYEPSMPPWGHSDMEAMRYTEEELNAMCDAAEKQKEDKVVKWILPVERKIEDGVDDYYIQFPDDLLEAANLKIGDQIEWIDRNDGSFELRKVNGIK